MTWSDSENTTAFPLGTAFARVAVGSQRLGALQNRRRWALAPTFTFLLLNANSTVGARREGNVTEEWRTAMQTGPGMNDE
ncbi:hypothetical protein B0H12DRAFT_222111 [Mycena haematopus]|nr:hypothetical protein B0H12DRAFT_222111 [Mycena haematopus]